MVRLAGLEPATFGTGNQRSNPLSYRRVAPAVGFEPTTFCSEDRRSDPLSYAGMKLNYRFAHLDSLKCSEPVAIGTDNLTFCDFFFERCHTVCLHELANDVLLLFKVVKIHHIIRIIEFAVSTRCGCFYCANILAHFAPAPPVFCNVRFLILIIVMTNGSPSLLYVFIWHMGIITYRCSSNPCRSSGDCCRLRENCFSLKFGEILKPDYFTIF